MYTDMPTPSPLRFQEIADPKVTRSLDSISTWIVAIGRFLKENNLDLPDTFAVKGSVDVRTLPDVKIANFADLSQSFLAIEQQLRMMSGVMASLKTEDTSQQDAQRNFDMLARTLGKGLSSLERAIGQATVKMGEDRVITVTPETNQSEIAETMKNVEGLLHKMYEMDVNRPTLVPPPVTRVVSIPQGERQYISPFPRLVLTATTNETTLIPATAGVFHDILSVIVVNTSATATQIDFRDSTGGTIRLTLYVPAGDMRGAALPAVLSQATANTTWTAQCGTSVSSIIITGQYVTNQ